MKLFRMESLSVQAKLLLAIFLPSLVVLAIAVTGMLLYDLNALKRTLFRQAEVNARIMARAMVGPLSTDDNLLATDKLSSLEADPNVILAVVYDEKRSVFAQFPALADLDTSNRPPVGQDGSTYSVILPIRMGEKVIGSIWLQTTLEHFYTRLYYSIAGAVAGFLVLVSVVGGMARYFHLQFSRPLQSLVETATKVSEQKDYSVRAPAQVAPEFNAVTSAFNHMLDEIDQRDRDLLKRRSELENANRELEAFSYSVAHDLRTPLRAIASYSQILRETEGETGKAERNELLQRIETNAARMAALIDDLLAFSRVDAEPLEKKLIAPELIAEQAWNELKSQQENRKVEFRLDPMPKANADEGLLLQVYLNLLSNALKYSRNQPVAVIHVGAEESNGKVTYFVKDNGVGFNMAFYDKLFGVFQRLHSGKEFEGTGVGLALVQRVIHRHGGKVWAESEQGKGAQFYFTLG
jgi:signal transduction histidine kinase